MGVRGELFSTRYFTKGGQKTYFFNVKEDRLSNVFFNFVESEKGRPGAGFNRHSIMVYEEVLPPFEEILKLALASLSAEKEFDDELTTADNRRSYQFHVERGRTGTFFDLKELSGSSNFGGKKDSIRIYSPEKDFFDESYDKMKAFYVDYAKAHGKL